jgi:hypothetical protein
MDFLRPGLNLSALKIAASTPAGKAEVRQMRDKLQAQRDHMAAEHERLLASADRLLMDMGIALGEIAP